MASFPTKVRNKERMFIFTTTIHYHTESPSQCNKTSKRNKITQSGTKEIKLSLFTENMIAFVEPLRPPRVHHQNEQYEFRKVTE